MYFDRRVDTCGQRSRTRVRILRHAAAVRRICLRQFSAELLDDRAQCVPGSDVPGKHDVGDSLVRPSGRLPERHQSRKGRPDNCRPRHRKVSRRDVRGPNTALCDHESWRDLGDNVPHDVSRRLRYQPCNPQRVGAVSLGDELPRRLEGDGTLGKLGGDDVPNPGDVVNERAVVCHDVRDFNLDRLDLVVAAEFVVLLGGRIRVAADDDETALRGGSQAPLAKLCRSERISGAWPIGGQSNVGPTR